MLARELKIDRVVIPRYPGVLSAAGLLAAPIEHEVSMAFPTPLEHLAPGTLREALGSLDHQCAALMAHEGVSDEEVTITYFADMWYLGQSYHLEVQIRLDDPDPLGRLSADFLKVHDRVYGYASEAPAGIVNLRSVHATAARASPG